MEGQTSYYSVEDKMYLARRVEVRYIRVLVEPCGGVSPAILLTYGIEQGEIGEWWQKTRAEVRRALGFTRRGLERARERLVSRGILEYKSFGMPRKGHYRVVPEAAARALNEGSRQWL